jgi:hypothetical protein
MHLACLLAFPVDRGNLHLEHEADRRLARRRQSSRDRLLDLGPQAEEARLRRHQLAFKLGAPGGVCEIAGRNDADALTRRPAGQVFEVQIAAGGARVFRVDVQVGVKTHCGHAQGCGPTGEGHTLRGALIRPKSSCG